MMAKIRVAIIEDHQSIIDGYKYRIEKDISISVVATGLNGAELFKIIRNHQLDLLILDVSIPTSEFNNEPIQIFQTVKTIKSEYPLLKIIIITISNQAPLIRKLLELNINGFILKDDRESIQNLTEIIRTVAEGEFHISKEAIAHIRELKDYSVRLSPRQKEILLICANFPDLTTHEIADILSLAHSTIRNQLSRIYARLGVHSRTAAIDRARELLLL